MITVSTSYEPVFDSILSNLPSIEVISVLLDEVYEFNDSNLLSTPSTKCVRTSI